MAEARELTEEGMREIASKPFDALVGFIDEPVGDEVRDPSGRLYRMKTHAFWDMEPEESALYVRVKVTGRGRRFLQRYFGVHVRLPDELRGNPEQPGHVSATWTEVAAWALLGLVVLACLLGVAYGISLVL